MNTSTENSTQVITREELYKHWQGHRDLTCRTIVAFPEEAFATFSIGGMRTFAQLCQELLAIAAPGIVELATGEQSAFNEPVFSTKEECLTLWDASTEQIDRYWKLIPEGRFQEHVKLFGQYEGNGWSQLFYFIDNEIHHRGQAYVYLRSLGIEPPAFWDRP